MFNQNKPVSIHSEYYEDMNFMLEWQKQYKTKTTEATEVNRNYRSESKAQTWKKSYYVRGPLAARPVEFLEYLFFLVFL